MAAANMVLLGAWTVWLTPLWLVATGATLGLLVLLTIYGTTWLLARRAAWFMVTTVREGILLPILYTTLFLAAVAVVLAPSMPVARLAESARRVMAVGHIQQTVEVPARTTDFQVPITFRAGELKRCTIQSQQDVVLATRPGVAAAATAGDTVDIDGGEPFRWQRSAYRSAPFEDRVDMLYVTNRSDAPSRVQFDLVTDVEYPEVFGIPATAACLVGLCLVYFAIAVTMPKLSAIAVATAREAISQPIFYLVLGLGAFALIVFIYVPYNTFGEDIKVLKDSGLTLIMVLSFIVALWTASLSIAEEIEGRTALTLLSKPIARRQFVLGKFLGIIWAVILLFTLLGLLFLVTVSYKVVYDAHESVTSSPTWQVCYAEMMGTVPGLVLALMETVVLASISVAISTRLPMIPNLIICSSVYVLGNLVPMIVNSSVGRFEIVGFVGRLIATVLPGLAYFNMQAAIAGGARVPPSYLGLALIYCVLYSTVAMLVALAMFEDRDLA